MVLTTLDVIGFIATRPTDLDKNALFVQQICHMNETATPLHAALAPRGFEPRPVKELTCFFACI